MKKSIEEFINVDNDKIIVPRQCAVTSIVLDNFELFKTMYCNLNDCLNYKKTFEVLRELEEKIIGEKPKKLDLREEISVGNGRFVVFDLINFNCVKDNESCSAIYRFTTIN